jgi:hypothetical protein
MIGIAVARARTLKFRATSMFTGILTLSQGDNPWQSKISWRQHPSA